MSYIFIIDSPVNLNIQKDTTVHLMKEFMRQEKEIFCCGINDLTIIEQNEVIFSCNKIKKISNNIDLEKSTTNNAKDFKTIFVRTYSFCCAKFVFSARQSNDEPI